MDNKLKILNYLARNNINESMHKLSSLLKIPYATFYRTIKKNDDLFEIKVIGKSKLIKLKKNNLIKHYLIISSYEQKKEFLLNNKIIKKISDELITNNIVLVFGSYAKGTQTKRSDLDIMIINEKGTKDVYFSKYELLFNIKINPIYFSYDEFLQMLRQEDNVAKEALRNHIILNNPEKFWEMALNGI